MAPRDAPQVLILRIYEYVSLHSKRDFAAVIKLRILRWVDYPGPKCNHTHPNKREIEGNLIDTEEKAM